MATNNQFNPYMQMQGMSGVPQWGTPPPGAMAGGAPQNQYYGTGPGQMGPASPNPQTGMPQAQFGPGQNQGPGEFGYGQAPGSSNRGYYEQQTPLGSFAASDGVQGMGQNTQQAQTTQAVNPYIGQQSTQASAATNPYAGMNNPYTEQAINSASQDAIRNYNTFTAPQRDAQMSRSGSFGNTGVQQMQLEDQRNLQGTLGNISNSARMADLFRQQDMGEAAAGRQTQTSQFNSNLGANDLGRNTNAALGLGTFNAAASNQGSQFNAAQGNQANNYMAGLQQQNNQFNATAGNNMLNRAVGQDQWNQTMDLNVDDKNWSRMRTGQQDEISWLGQLYNYGQGGINNTTNVQNTPLNYNQQFAQSGQGLGGMGGTNSQNMQGNPHLGFLGGLGLGGQIYNNWNRPGG